MFVDTGMFCVSCFAVKLAWGPVCGVSTSGEYPCSWGYGNDTVFLETLVLEGNTNLESHARKAALPQSAEVA